MSSLFDSKFKEDFIKTLRTKKVASSFSDLVDTVSSESFKTSKVTLTNLIPESHPKWFILLLNKVGKDTLISEFRDDLENLRDEILALEEINIKMPFKPSDNFLEEVAKVFDNAGYKNYLINLEIDKTGSLVSGFSIEGKYLSISLRNYIRNHLMSNNVYERKI